MHQITNGFGQCPGAKAVGVEAGDTNFTFAHDRIVQRFQAHNLIESKAGSGTADRFSCDLQPVFKTRRPYELYVSRNDSKDKMLSLHKLSLIDTGGDQPFGAGAFEEFQIVGVVNNTTCIGVLVVNGNPEAEWLSQVVNPGQLVCQTPRSRAIDLIGDYFFRKRDIVTVFWSRSGI